MQDALEKVKKFDERMVTFQIEIKTVEKCMREDIGKANSIKSYRKYAKI